MKQLCVDRNDIHTGTPPTTPPKKTTTKKQKTNNQI